MKLRYVPYPELQRLLALDCERAARAALFADACRLNALYMIARAGSGHVGTSFSCIDMLAWLHLEVLGSGDRYFSSKGHDAPALYSVLLGTGRLEFDLIHRLRQFPGLPGHPDVRITPEAVTSTGSLGMGISKAKGFALADRLAGATGETYVLTGDGELQEGQFWESLGSAANRAIDRINVIVDHNKIQSDTWVSEVSDLGDLEAKVRAFGWAVARCDGNDVGAFAAALEQLRANAPERPRLLIADTVKGAGVTLFGPAGLPQSATALYGFHSGAPSAADYEAAADELEARLERGLAAWGEPGPALEQADPPRRRPVPQAAVRLVSAYGEALADAAGSDDRIVALDADLVLDCGLVPFRERHPERFFECGIAEQDMVSQAGTMALSGLVPFVHSFACFLTARPNEQIYNNATEGTKVVYVGSLAGLLPGGPGHSHQAVRDIAAMGAVPGMAMIEPCTEEQVRHAVRWAVEEAPGPVYLRLVSVPWDPGLAPADPALVPGRGEVVREGGDALFVAAGPVMLSQACTAAELLDGEGIGCGIVAMPWLADIDGAWLAELASGSRVVCLDNHYVKGGQGDAVLRALAHAGASPPVTRIGVTSIPVCGEDAEVLSAHGLSAESIAARVRAELRT